jgi:hypothetical protein
MVGCSSRRIYEEDIQDSPWIHVSPTIYQSDCHVPCPCCDPISLIRKDFAIARIVLHHHFPPLTQSKSFAKMRTTYVTERETRSEEEAAVANLASVRSNRQVPCSQTYAGNIASQGGGLCWPSRAVNASGNGITSGHLPPTTSKAGHVSNSPSTISSRQGTPSKTIKTSDLSVSSNNSSNREQHLDHARRRQMDAWLSNPEAYSCCMGNRENVKNVDIHHLFTRLREVGLDQNEKSSGAMAQKTAYPRSAEGMNAETGGGFLLAGIGTWVDHPTITKSGF